MSVYPGSIPPAGSAVASDTLAAAGHTALHNTSYDEIRALATKLGTGSSTATASTVLRGTGAGTSAWGQVALTTDVTGTLPVGSGGTGGTTAATARTSIGAASLSDVYPVGCIYTETTGVNPGTTFGFGTWIAFGGGRVLIGDGTSDAAYTAGGTGGESTHILTTAELASHTHGLTNALTYVATGGSNTASAPGGTDWAFKTVTDATGSGTAHNNLQPYIVVFFWKRTV